MTIPPVAFVIAPPVAPIEKVASVRRRSKSQKRRETAENPAPTEAEPVYAAQSAEELASDEARDALINLKLGG